MVENQQIPEVGVDLLHVATQQNESLKLHRKLPLPPSVHVEVYHLLSLDFKVIPLCHLLYFLKSLLLLLYLLGHVYLLVAFLLYTLVCLQL